MAETHSAEDEELSLSREEKIERISKALRHVSDDKLRLIAAVIDL